MDKITKFRIKKPDNTLSEEIPISTTVQNVIYNQNQSLDDILGVVDIDNKGDIQYQLDELNDKIDQASFELTDEAKEMVVNAVLEIYPKAAQGDFITAQDEGKVVQNRKLVPQTKLKVSENGIYTTTLNNRVQVEVYPNLQSKYVTVNGIVTPDSGYDGLSDVEVDVSLQSLLQSKIVTQNGTVTADTGYEGLSEVTIDIQPLLQDKTITSNGTFYPDNGYEGFRNVEVDVDVEEAIIMPFNVIQNGFYELERDIDGFSIVTASVDNTYFDQDEKKVVRNSELVEQNSLTVTENGTLDTTYIGTLTINVPGGNDVLGPTKITENGTFVPETGVTGFNSVEVKVPNSYGIADEGKVVYNKKLINQISKTVTKNGVYNITTNNQVIVNVKGGPGSADSEGKPNTTPGSPSPGGAGSAVVGTDPETGNDVVVGVDEDGNLVRTSLPSFIVLVTPPSKMNYRDGETIDLSGAVVTAKMADGTTWTDAEHPNGHVSCLPDPNTASSDGDESSTSTLVPIPINITHTAHLTYASGPIETTEFSNGSGWQTHVAQSSGGSATCGYFGCFASESPETILVVSVDGVQPVYQTLNQNYTYGGKTVYYKNTSSSDDYFIRGSASNETSRDVLEYDWGAIAWTMVHGDITENTQTISLNWARPGDGKVLSTTIEINVGTHTTESNNGGETF